jgi:uncharacterized protein
MNMIGLIVELLLSWMLLKFVEKQGLEAIGWKPNRQRIIQFTLGLLIPIVYVILLQWSLAVLTKNPYRVNPYYTVTDFFEAAAYVFRSVAYENLFFTGALLYILARRVGPQWAILISGVAFGIYHWFSWELWGEPARMLIVFLMTGVPGYIWALAFVRTRSIYLPFGLHYGIDFASMVLFSQDKRIGQQLFIHTFDKDPAAPGGVIALVIIIIYYAGFPLLSWLYVRGLGHYGYLCKGHNIMKKDRI